MEFTFIQFCIVSTDRTPHISTPLTQFLMLGICSGWAHPCDHYEMPRTGDTFLSPCHLYRNTRVTGEL